MQVSINGGTTPRWRRDGKEMFYVVGETLMAVRVAADPNFSVGEPERLFDQQGISRTSGQQYDVSADGQRFVVVETVGAENQKTTICLVQNWDQEFVER